MAGIYIPFPASRGRWLLSEMLNEMMVVMDRRTNELAQLVKEMLGVLNAFAKSKTSKLGI